MAMQNEGDCTSGIDRKCFAVLCGAAHRLHMLIRSIYKSIAQTCDSSQRRVLQVPAFELRSRWDLPWEPRCGGTARGTVLVRSENLYLVASSLTFLRVVQLGCKWGANHRDTDHTEFDICAAVGESAIKSETK